MNLFQLFKDEVDVISSIDGTKIVRGFSFIYILIFSNYQILQEKEPGYNVKFIPSFRTPL